MAKKRSLKKVVVSVPKDLSEAAEFVRSLGAEAREIDVINVKLNKDIEVLKSKAMERVAPHSKRQMDLLEGLHTFAEARRPELTDDNKKKTVDLPTGTFCWKFTPPAVSIKGTAEVVERIKGLNLQRFLRVKTEIDKEAMLKEPDVAKTIKGVTIGQKEEFVVKPSETNVEIKVTLD